MVSRYVTGGPVKQDGICLLPPPPTHYRMMSPQLGLRYQPILPQQPNRSDPYPVTAPAGTYVQQTQGPNQGSGLRGMAPVPPNQSSTPPNADLKVQGLSGQIPQLQFVPNTVRSSGPYYPRGPAGGPPNQASRMPAQQHRPQNQLFASNSYIMPMYVPSAYYQSRPNFAITQQYPTYPPTLGFNNIPQQGSSGMAPYLFYQQTAPPTMMPRASLNPPASAPPNTVSGSNMPTQLLPPMNQGHSSFPRSNQKVRRPNALRIIDPDTGEDKLNEIFDEHNSHPHSAESSARQTPQPAPPNNNKEVQAMFADQVARAISNDVKPDNRKDTFGIDLPTVDHRSRSPSPQSVEFDNVNIQFTNKDFMPIKKEVTPIVSANSDAAEVIISKKESPSKARKSNTREKTEILKDHQKDDKIPVAKEEKQCVTKVPTHNPVHVLDPVLVPPSAKESITKDSDKKLKKLSTSDSEPAPVQVNETSSTTSGKAKNNRNKQNAKPQPQTQQGSHVQPQLQASQQHVLPAVPAPQPPKINNKSSKSKELNLKGASKEGTDMDAFNDNSSKGEINANVLLPIAKQNIKADTINANSITQNIEHNNETDLGSPYKNEAESDSADNSILVKPEPIPINNNPPIFTSAPKPVNKPFDVTSIVKDPPKTIIPPFQISDCHEESEKLYSIEKASILKTDTKVSLENEINSVKSQLPYRPGQWTPDNSNGSRAYDRDFLMALRNLPASRRKPDNLLDAVLAEDRNRAPLDSRLVVGGRNEYTSTTYPPYGPKSGSQRGTLPKRNSQSKVGSRSSDKNSKPQPKVSISLRGDIKLHEAENAWKPTRLQKSASASEEDKKTEVLYKKVRSVLNKLTPQKFETLVNQFRQFKIDTKDRLLGVINLVFEKAIDEPNFSVAYAKMCKELQIMQVPSGAQAEDNRNVAFRTLLVNRCQSEFEKHSVDETERNNKLREIDECTDIEKKKELSFELEEYDRRLRMKSVGTIRFIGELFKQQMLTAAIMKRCLQTLLENKDEESLECLCKLLTTVGKELENKNIDLSSIFDEMKKIADGKKSKVSSRIKFMLQDVIDLRDSKWIPRRGDTNPKTIDQIQKEAENEQFSISLNTSRKEERSNGSRGSGSGGPRQKSNEEGGWSSVSSRSKSINIQSEKMRAKLMSFDAPLGSSQMFDNWGKGASGSKISQPTYGSNMYAALEVMDNERRSTNTRGKDPYSSKGPSLERNSYKTYDGRGSRSGSQQRDTTSRSGIMPSGPPSLSLSTTSSKPFVQPQPVAPAAPPDMPEDKLIRYIVNSLEEVLEDCCTFETFFQDLSSTIPPNSFKLMVTESFNHVLEKSLQARLKIGSLFSYLLKSGFLSYDTFYLGLDEFLSCCDDLVIDIPQIWQYIAEQLVPLYMDESSTLQNLPRVLFKLGKSQQTKILKSLFAQIISLKGHNFLQSIWSKSGIQLSCFMHENDVSNFIAENKLQFLKDGLPVGQNSASYDQIYSKLKHLFAQPASFDDIVNWISVNVGDKVTENKFIRILATAIFEDSIQNNKLVTHILQGHYKLIQKYADNNTSYELQCLYSLQALIDKMDHPQGLLLSICNQLYEDTIFCQESFIAWESSTDPAEQGRKGVAMLQLTSFFTQLRENEEEDYSSNSEDA
ncbi:eukaryotic translation initiation factor 4 gamma 1-like isoform X2 [Rhynchophorus ferrugineus]|uniref:eukaryotic translation initiation factor 4 gamma 1-like isoform X2 n=1 Tax=Rhynchophorus ferrugineus TaxID=354439 RepID=UPI003FCD76FD